MTGDDRTLTGLLRNVYLTPDVEIDCSTCLDHVATYVDTELAGRDAAGDMPDLHRHLALCGDCREEYEALRDLAALDASAGIPDRSALLRELDDGRHEPRTP